MNRLLGKMNLVLPKDMEYIYTCAEKGDSKSLQVSLRSGGSINFIHPTTTDSPLMIACRRGYNDVVKICLDYGAKNDPHPDYGQTALHAAVASGRITCASTLLKVAQASEADTIISNLTDQYGQTPLHTASIIGSVPIAELLLQHGARISSIDTYGQTPLHLCAGSGHNFMLALLLDQGGDALIDLPDVYGNSPLHHAAFHGKLECAKLLLETAASVRARNNEGLTAFNLASIHGHSQISHLIQEYRSHYSGPDSRMFEPRQYRSESYGANANIDSFSSGSTPKPNFHGDSLYGTLQTTHKLEIAVPDSLRKHDSRRNQPYRGTGADPYYGQDLQLPRPHTVSSPALNFKHSKSRSGGSPRSSQINAEIDGLTSSPHSDSAMTYTDQHADFSHRESRAESGDMYGGYRVVSQLSTPLIIREKRSAQVPHRYQSN
jgi:ankyrin repeat protein